MAAISSDSMPGAIVTPVVLVGLCAHGLAITRSLGRAGIPVIALESDRNLPGFRTRFAEVIHCIDINEQGLIDELLDLSTKRQFKAKPVLMLTNDRMVALVSNNLNRINSHYSVSWEGCANYISAFLSKTNIEERCHSVGLNYPTTVIIENIDQLGSSLQGLNFPVIAKPARPLSAFKTLVAMNEAELLEKVDLLNSCLPLLLQQYIPGGDEKIAFGAICLRQGEILARFEGRKLRSYPMGHTTVAIPEKNDDVHQLVMRFFDGLRMSGPLSLEVKQGNDGRWWVIEPTVGRTDFWSGLCAMNGVDLSRAEYNSVTCGNNKFEQTTASLWINEERDPIGIFVVGLRFPGVFIKYRIRGVFFDAKDLYPFFMGYSGIASNISRRLISKIIKIISKKL